MVTMWRTGTSSPPRIGTQTGSSPCRGRAPVASQRWNGSGRPRWFPDLSATVKAYWALKFAGFSPDHPVLVAARTRTDALGDIHRAKTYPKVYLALFGLYGWEGVASLPPPTHAPRRSLR
jgi:hypothetical protein